MITYAFQERTSFTISKWLCFFIPSRERFSSEAQLTVYHSTVITILSFIKAHLQNNLLCFHINFDNQLSNECSHWLNLVNLRINKYGRSDKKKQKNKKQKRDGCVKIYQVKMKCYFRCVSFFSADLQSKY